MNEKVARDTRWTMQPALATPTPTAVWACRSRFCLRRGPFWVRSRGQSFIGFLREMRLAPAVTRS